MADEMRSKLGVRLSVNHSSKNEILSALADEAELLLGQCRHRDLGCNSIDIWDHGRYFGTGFETTLGTTSVLPGRYKLRHVSKL